MSSSININIINQPFTTSDDDKRNWARFNAIFQWTNTVYGCNNFCYSCNNFCYGCNKLCYGCNKLCYSCTVTDTSSHHLFWVRTISHQVRAQKSTIQRRDGRDGTSHATLNNTYHNMNGDGPIGCKYLYTQQSTTHTHTHKI